MEEPKITTEGLDVPPFKVQISFDDKITERMLDGLNHANYLKTLVLFEDAQRALREEIGISLEKLKEQGLALMVVDMQNKYHAELFLHDEVKTTMSAYLEGATLKFSGKLLKGGELMMEYLTTMVLVSLDTQKRLLDFLPGLRIFSDV